MKKNLLPVLFFIAAISSSNKSLAQKKEGDQNSISATKIEPISPKQLASTGFADIVEELLPAVVNISTVQEIAASSTNIIDQIFPKELSKNPLLDDFRGQLEKQFRTQQNQKKKVSSVGSGFIISREGFIVTNNHVIEEADEITVSLNDGSKHKAKLIGADKKTDLALLKINAGNDLKFVKFGDSTKARIGDWVIVIGNPYGLGGSVSVGIVSARSRDINDGQSDEFLQTDAAINKGSSGGPMFNSKGEVIGISTAIFSPFGGGNIGIGFARPSSIASSVIWQLKDRGEVVRGWLGVSIQDVSEEIAESMKMDKAEGAFVVEVTKGGPADKAGILPTDIITKIDDHQIDEMKILPKIVMQYPVGKTAKLTVLRRGKSKVFKVKIDKMKSDEAKKSETKFLTIEKSRKPEAEILGLGLTELNKKIRDEKNISDEVKGLLIATINQKSEAAEKGVMIGDILLSANQAPINSIDDLRSIIDETKRSTKKLFLFLKRKEANYSVVLDLK